MNAPESDVSGGFTKKSVSCACRADFVNVAMNVPMLIPHNKQSAAAAITNKTFPRKGIPNTTRMITTANVPIMHSSTKSGKSFATMICVVDAGDINSCSSVPASRSFTIAAAEISEPFRIRSTPRIPVTINHVGSSPGLYKIRGMQQDHAEAAHVRRGDLLKPRVNSLARERLVVGRDHALRVSLADRCRVGIHGVQQHLHGGGPAALQIARVVVRDHEPGIQIAVRDFLAHFVHVEI